MALPGDRIRLIAMPDDPDPILAGSVGTVISATTGRFAQIEVEWDTQPDGSRRTLALIPGVDRYEIVKLAPDNP